MEASKKLLVIGWVEPPHSVIVPIRDNGDCFRVLLKPSVLRGGGVYFRYRIHTPTCEDPRLEGTPPKTDSDI